MKISVYKTETHYAAAAFNLVPEEGKIQEGEIIFHLDLLF